MTSTLSLRFRLTLIILVPLLFISLLLGAWSVLDARRSAGEDFDRSLLSTALAISRDTAQSRGSALSQETRDLLRDTSGGTVFYHVYAPDGVWVTGYATPPVPPPGQGGIVSDRFYYDSVYLGQPVRALRFRESMTIDGFTGKFTFSVWQNTSIRQSLVNSLTRRTSAIILSLVTALAMIVWFGVRFGLLPLRDLELAIEKRTASDLSPITRGVPAEVQGIVGTLNRLLTDMAETFDRMDDFVSNAAHQLRNPIAGVLGLAESLYRAPAHIDLRSRSEDLFEAALALSKLADGLLTIERARSSMMSNFKHIELSLILDEIAKADFRRRCADRGIDLVIQAPEPDLVVLVDPLLLEQAILNLLENALLHGGSELTRIRLIAESRDSSCIISVIDDGKGIAEVDMEVALSRFGQVDPSHGSGLGLPIAMAAAEAFGGTLTLRHETPGLRVDLSLPLQGLN